MLLIGHPCVDGIVQKVTQCYLLLESFALLQVSQVTIVPVGLEPHLELLEPSEVLSLNGELPDEIFSADDSQHYNKMLSTGDDSFLSRAFRVLL